MSLPSWAAVAPDEDRPHVSRFAQAIDAVDTAHTLWRRGRNWYHERTRYVVRITSTDAVLYREVQARVLAALPDREQRALRAYTTRGSSPEPWDDDDVFPSGGEQVKAKLRFTFDAKQRTVTIDVDGHPIRIGIDSADGMPQGAGRPMDMSYQKLAPDTLRLEARDRAGLDALQAMLQRIVEESNRHERQPALWTVNHWGNWGRHTDQPWRTLDTVVLAEGQRERLVADLEEFLKREKTYVRNGWPWHRGYLLYGPPGTGKTSLVKGLAHHFGLDLWALSLSDLSKDASLLGLVAEVHPRSVLLIEDIDSFDAATTREGEAGKISMSGLLNAIDGVATPHGLITIFTTNHPEKLDPALMRPGRLDVREEIALPTGEQAARLFRAVYGEGPSTVWRVREGMTTADLMEIFKRHIDDPDGAEAELRGATPEVARRIAHVGRVLAGAEG